MLRDTEIAVLTTAPADYDYTRVTRELLTGITARDTRKPEQWRLVAIDQDPEHGSFGRNQCARYGSGLHAAIPLDDADKLDVLGLPSADLLLAQARAQHDAELRAATRDVVAHVVRGDVDLLDDTERTVTALARAVALILMIDAHPERSTDTIRLAPSTRAQLREALGLD